MTGECCPAGPAASSHPHAEAPETAAEASKTPRSRHGSRLAGGLAGEIHPLAGKFHPPAANFPIALLVAARSLRSSWRRATGLRPLFDAANRFCLWFGAWLPS